MLRLLKVVSTSTTPTLPCLHRRSLWIGSSLPPRRTMLLAPVHGSNISASKVLPSRSFRVGWSIATALLPMCQLDQIVPVIIDCPSERRTPESAHQRGPTEFFIQADVLGRSFAALFQGSPRRSPRPLTFSPRFGASFCINSAGSISALVGKPAGVFRDEAIGRATLEVVRECAAVGRAIGAILDEDLPQKVLAQYRSYPVDSTNSLLADRLAGRPMETDARISVIVRNGRKHNIPTPLNGLLLTLLQAI